MIVNLKRFAYTPMGVFGLLTAGPNFKCYTVEQRWLNNKVGASCIPPGLYQLKRSRYNRGGYDTYELLDVPDRTQIKIHIANTFNELRGCIAPGTTLGAVAGKWAVTNSRVAFSDLVEVLNNDPSKHSINITTELA